MLIAEEFKFDFNVRNNQSNNLLCSTGPSDAEKQLKEKLKKRFSEREHDFLSEHNITTVNFDIEIRNGTILVKGYHLVFNDGSVEYLELSSPTRYKRRANGNMLSTTLRKVGAIMEKNMRHFPVGKFGAVTSLALGLIAIISVMLGRKAFSTPGALLIIIISMYVAYLCWNVSNDRKRVD